jgi:hypothetical protein
MSDVIRSKTFNSKMITFSDVKTNKYGGKSVYINYDGGKLRIQTPKMKLPYGLIEDEIRDKTTDEVTGTKYSLNLSFSGMEQTEDNSLDSRDLNNCKKIKDFHSMIKQIEEKVIEQCKNNSMAYIRQKNASSDICRALFHENIRVSRDKETGEPDGKWPDTIKIKIPFWEGVFKSEIYDENRQEVDLKEYIIKGVRTVSLIECTGIWFVGGKYGIGWKLVQSQVKYRPTSTLSGFSIIPDSDDEDDETMLNNDVNQIKNDNVSVDSDDDHSDQVDNTQNNEQEQDNDLDEGIDSSDDEEEEALPPPPRRKKK